MFWIFGTGRLAFLRAMKKTVSNYEETTYFVGVVEVHARELPLIQRALIERGLKGHVKIDGVMSTKSEKLQIGLFVYEREDGEKIIAFLEEQTKRESELLASRKRLS